MKARVKWVEAMSFVGESGSGHSVVMDGAPEVGGRDLGIRPMEMVLLGMCGCSAFDVVYILQRGRHKVADCVVDAEAERSDTPPKVFTKIHLHYTVSGEGLSEEAARRAVELSVEKYCSVSAMLRDRVEISYDLTLVAT